MIVTVDIFEGEISIGQAENPVIAANIQVFIAKYEPLFLTKLIGESLYNELIRGLEEIPVPDKWNELSDLVKLPCANYIYYRYMEDKATDTSGFGVTVPESENSNRVTHIHKIVRAWNEMVDLNRRIKCKLTSNEDYPGYRFCPSDIYRKTNSFGI